MFNRPQTLPAADWAAIHVPWRSRVPTDTSDWKRILRADPCAYCGSGSKQIDHIVPRSAGGWNNWENTTGACIRCNQAKSYTGLLQYMAARTGSAEHMQPQAHELDGLLLAVADLRKTPYLARLGSNRTNELLQKLLDARPDVDGALAYRKRRAARWVHIVLLRDGRGHAGELCRRRGGGGNTTRGGFENRRPVFATD